MKNLGITLAALTLTVNAFSQGQLNFNNRVTSGSVDSQFFAPVYGVNPAAPATRISGNASTNKGTANYTGVPLLLGAGFTASLWESTGGPLTDLGNYSKIGGNVTFRTAAAAGGVFGSAPVINTLADSGTASSFQVRAWDNKGGTIGTWADALAASQRGEAGAGYSDAFTLTVGGGALVPANMLTMKSFNLTIVPEPSLIALGALGFGALLLRRRK